MARLTISTLGPPKIILDDAPVAGLASDKVRALLFYLAVEAGRAHRRESLAGLLWPDYPERSARTNLSNALSNLRTALGDREATAPFFHVSREAIQFNAHSDCRVDAAAFEELVSCGEWEEAIALYHGDCARRAGRGGVRCCLGGGRSTELGGGGHSGTGTQEQ